MQSVTTNTLPMTPRKEPAVLFEHLLEKYSTFLRNVIAGNCPPSLGIQTSDIEQEARLRLWRTLDREQHLAEPAAYIYRIAVSTTIDAVRRVLARREEQLWEPDRDSGEPARDMMAIPEMTSDPNHAPDAVAERRQLMAHIRDALSTLSANRRRTVELHLQGLSLGEIAQLLGWTEGKVRNLVYRGLSDLRDALRERGIDYE